MAGIEAKSFDSPDETRAFHAHGHADVVEMNGHTVLRSVFVDFGDVANYATAG